MSEGLPKDVQGNRWKAGLTIVTPERRFLFTCPSEKEQGEWLESFRDVLSRPLTSFNLLSKMQGLGTVLLAKGRGQEAASSHGSALSPEAEVMAPDCAFSILFLPKKRTDRGQDSQQPALSTLSPSSRRPSPVASGVWSWQNPVRSPSRLC